LPAGPEIASFAPIPDAATLIVLPPVDQRPDQQLGTIGMAQLSLRENPSSLIAREAVAVLHAHHINALLRPVASEDLAVMAEEIRKLQADGVLALTITNVSIESFDALLDPPTAIVGLDARLYDRHGMMVKTASTTGEIRRLINSFVIEKAAGKLIAEAARDALERLISRSAMAEFLQTLGTIQQAQQEVSP